MGRTACTKPQCLYSTAIPLLPLWAVRPVQSLSACTVQLYLYSSCSPYGLYRASVPVQYSYTSTPPVRRTACTEPQCVYKGALFFFTLPKFNGNDSSDSAEDVRSVVYALIKHEVTATHRCHVALNMVHMTHQRTCSCTYVHYLHMTLYT